MKAKPYYFAGFLKDYEGILTALDYSRQEEGFQGAEADGPAAGAADRCRYVHRITCLCRVLLLLVLLLPIVLLKLPVQRFAADAEGAGGVRLVAVSVVEGGFNGLALDLFH